jgi:type I restriction enzyme S subunit
MKQLSLDSQIRTGAIQLGRGNIISATDIANKPGDYPIYSSSAQGTGEFGRYADYMFDEELITWSVDGGGRFFFRPKHKFSVTNVCGYMRTQDEVWNRGFVYYSLDFQHSRMAFDYQTKAHPSVIRHIYSLGDVSLPEQTEIADILFTVDRAIDETDALIVKQQYIKTGLMRNLFTSGIDQHGSVRSEQNHKFKHSPLGRIPIEWGFSRLESIGRWASGGTPAKANPNYWGDEVPWLCPKDMKTFDIDSTIDRLTQAGVRHGSRLMPEKTVFIVVRGMILAHTFPVCIANRPMAFNQDVKAIAAGPDVEARFLAYWLVSQSDNFLKLTTTATHGTKRFDMSELFDVVMPVPEKEEQTRVVARLDAAEAQIDSNRKIVSKLHSLKTALMQDLLTGRKSLAALLEPEPKSEKTYAQR